MELPEERTNVLSLRKLQAFDTPNVGLLEHCKSSNEAMEVLLHITDALHLEQEHFPVAVKILCDHFHQQNETTVRAQILSSFCTLGDVPGADTELIAVRVMKLVEKETSHKVIAQGLLTILHLSKCLPSTSVTLTRIFNIAKDFLKDTNHYVKRICLQLIASINVGDNMRLIADYIFSQDARVRCTAMEALVVLHEKGDLLDVSLYSGVCKVLNDDYEIVRVVALKIVSLIGNTYPEFQVKVPKRNTRRRLIDDAFAKVCQAVNDLSQHVRQIAMKLLGTMTAVSKNFLTQTLDKKLMSSKRRNKFRHKQKRVMVFSVKTSTSKIYSNEFLYEDEGSIVSSGAFVHGLEDEYMEVRTAAVEAVCTLAMAHPDFAPFTLDFLVDMFDDEIEGVRIKAIDSLTLMSRHILLREHQLQTILDALEDTSTDVREGIHRIIATCGFATKNCLQICIDYLHGNLRKYPQDKNSTWKCCQEIGRKHSDFTLLLVPKLLGIHPFFDTPEPDVEDPVYVSMLILVFNAAQNCPPMLQLFQEHTVRHYSYLRVTLPSLVPHLKLPGPAVFVEPVGTTTSDGLLWRLVDSLSIARPSMFQNVLPQLDCLARIDSSIEGPAQFISMFISCQILLDKILKNRSWCSNAGTPFQYSAIKSNFNQLLLLSFKLQYLFVGLGKEELAAVKQFHLKAVALHLVHIVKAPNLSALALCEHFIKKAEQMKQFLFENELLPDEFCKGVLPLITTLEDTKPGAVARYLIPPLSNVNMIQPPKPNLKVRKCRAILSGPTTKPEAPLKFTAGLAMAVQLDAELFGLKDPLALRVKVFYPDHRTHYSMLPESHLRPLNEEGDYRLRTQTLVSSRSAWTAACYIQISLCIELSDGDMNQRAHYGFDPYLELCKPFKLYILPKPIIRGI